MFKRYIVRHTDGGKRTRTFGKMPHGPPINAGGLTLASSSYGSSVKQIMSVSYPLSPASTSSDSSSSSRLFGVTMGSPSPFSRLRQIALWTEDGLRYGLFRRDSWSMTRAGVGPK